ncbi:MAG: hypothetical protein HY332_14525 [Chloroflexi bacterium]|nr:hypothetical protein [Chloroflexota bacterium]
MYTAAIIIQRLVWVSGLVQITTGLLFWTGNVLALIPLHMLNGLVLALLLWSLVRLAARAGVHPGYVSLAVVWGIVVPVFGLTQSGMLVGPWHWVIQVAHLLVGMGAMGQAEGLARRIKGRPQLRPAAVA